MKNKYDFLKKLFNIFCHNSWFFLINFVYFLADIKTNKKNKKVYLLKNKLLKNILYLN